VSTLLNFQIRSLMEWAYSWGKYGTAGRF